MYTMYFITVLFAVLIPLIFPSFLFFLFLWTELSWKLIKNVFLNRGPNKLMLQCPSLLHQMYMLFINWMYFICDNKLSWTWTWTWKQFRCYQLYQPMMVGRHGRHLRNCVRKQNAWTWNKPPPDPWLHCIPRLRCACKLGCLATWVWRNLLGL